MAIDNMAEKETTLLLLKPEVVESESYPDLMMAIMQEIEQLEGIEIGAGVRLRLNKSEVEQFYSLAYARHGEKIRRYLDYMTSRGLVVFLIEGKDARRRVKEKLGSTDPANAENGTIRKKFGRDSMEKSRKEGRAVLNLAHAPDSEEEFDVNYNVLKKYLE
ncbi:hypothetical protein HYW76_02965 [Candidatus Pacearchaeota archaeon]|nr:hypothetical protein [Candidatus Pacearchaeota archaeon]